MIMMMFMMMNWLRRHKAVLQEEQKHKGYLSLISSIDFSQDSVALATQQNLEQQQQFCVIFFKC